MDDGATGWTSGARSAFAVGRVVLRRLERVSSWVSLRRLPVVVALAVGILSAPMIWWMGDRWADEVTNRTWAYVERDAITRNARVMAMLAGGPKVDDSGSWLVYPAERRVEALGETDIEPPLYQLADGAKDAPNQDYFTQRDRPFVAYTSPVDGKVWAVTTVETGWVASRQSRQRRSIMRSGALAWLVLVAAAGVLTRWLSRPARRTLGERADFLADAAHEMRTPLAVIQASAGHALSKPRSSEEYVRSLSEIRSAAERASTGVTELLDLARFDAGQAVPRFAPMRLDLLAEEVAAGTRMEGCEVSVVVGPSVLVEADMALMRQAVDNVVRNAASRAEHVVITCAVEGRDGVLRVSDDGPGFPPEQLPYVFERYRRGDARGSLGLGLPIAASIVAAHGGRVDIESPTSLEPATPDRPGATVIFRLPRSRMAG